MATNQMIIPEVVNHFNVYKSGNKVVGVSGEVTLPDLEALTDTIEGSGVLGEVEDPVTGQFKSMTIKIPFATLYESVYSICSTTKPGELTLRGSMQCMDPTTGETDYYPLKVVVRGKAKKITNGKLVKGKKMEAEVELEVLYIKITINSTTVLELDKLNFKYVLNGEDMLAKVRSQV